jgi:uncharacterized protein
MEAENSANGINKNRHWRDSKGWFSYKMTDKEMQAGKLRVTYFGRDDNRRFTIIVNDQIIAEVALDGSHGDYFYTVDYILPDAKVRVPANQHQQCEFRCVGTCTGAVGNTTDCVKYLLHEK